MPFHEHRHPPCPLENAGESTPHFTLWQAPPTNPDCLDRAGQSATFSATIRLVDQFQPPLLCGRPAMETDCPQISDFGRLVSPPCIFFPRRVKNELAVGQPEPVVSGDSAETLFFGIGQTMAEGTIKRLTDRGFGFIDTGAGEDIFFHNSNLEGVSYDDLQEGQRVSYTEGSGPKGPRAENVKPI